VFAQDLGSGNRNVGATSSASCWSIRVIIRVVFVKTTRVRRGNRTYEYVSLVEAEREGGKVGHRTLLRLGEASALRESGQLDRIIAALRAHAEGTWLDASELGAQGAPAIGAMAVAHAYWERLECDRHYAKLGAERGAPTLADTVFAMVANRLLAPSSKRHLIEWLAEDVVAPDGVTVPSLDQCYRALDAVAAAKDATEVHLYGRLTDLTNLDLRLVCYDLTSTYFEGDRRPSARFASRAFGYSRDHRPDRPQVVLGLLCTSDGIPIAHHVFSGDTADVATLPAVLDDLQRRFGVGKVCVVADRGLISKENIAALDQHGFEHVLATKLHRDPTCAAALVASAAPEATWVPVPQARSAACEVVVDGKRCVVVASVERWSRDRMKTIELIAKTEAEFLALEARVRAGHLKEEKAIARAAQRILDRSPVARLFDVEIAPGRFIYHYDEPAHAYEELLAGRYVLTTSLDTAHASTAQVVVAYRQLLGVEHRFRVLKDFLALRPVFHWTEQRVRGHIGICVTAAVIEALITNDLRVHDVRDPDLRDQHASARRCLDALQRVRRVALDAGDTTVQVVTRRNAFQAHCLAALGVDTHTWDRAQLP